MALALQNREKAKARRKKKEGRECECCPVDPPEDKQRYNIENSLRKDFDFRNNWYHFVSFFLGDRKAK